MAGPEKPLITPDIETVSDWRAEMDTDAAKQEKTPEQKKTLIEKIRQAVEEAGGGLTGAQSQLTPGEFTEACEIAQQVKKQRKSP